MYKKESDFVPGSLGKVPGPDRTGPRDLEGPVVPWSRELTSPKVPGLENWKSPGTMETLVYTHIFFIFTCDIYELGTYF